MKVSELIEALSKVPDQEVEVFMPSDSFSGYEIYETVKSAKFYDEASSISGVYLSGIFE